MSLYTDHGPSKLPTFLCSLATHWTVNDHIYSALSPAHHWRVVKSETHFSILLSSAALSNSDFSLPYQQIFSSQKPPLKEQLWITVCQMEFYAAVCLLTLLTEFQFVTLQCHPTYTASSTSLSDSQSMLSVVTRSSLFLNVQQQWPTNVDQEVMDDVLTYRLHVTCSQGRIKLWTIFSWRLSWLCAACWSISNRTHITVLLSKHSTSNAHFSACFMFILTVRFRQLTHSGIRMSVI